jgi:hypothetical protein
MLVLGNMFMLTKLKINNFKGLKLFIFIKAFFIFIYYIDNVYYIS